MLLVKTLLRLTGIVSWIIWWVGDVLSLIFCDKVWREEESKNAAIDVWEMSKKLFYLFKLEDSSC